MIYTVVSYKVANTKHSIVQSLPTIIEPGGCIQQPLSIAGYSGITETRSIIEQKELVWVLPVSDGFSLNIYPNSHDLMTSLVELELKYWDLKPSTHYLSPTPWIVVVQAFLPHSAPSWILS